MHLFPPPDHLQPLRMRHRFRRPVQGGQNRFEIRHDTEIGRNVFVDFRSIDIDVNDPGAGGKSFRIPGGTVGETGTEHQQQIALVDGIVGAIASMHAEKFQ